MSRVGTKTNRCCVPNCPVNSVSFPDVVLHQFPRDPTRVEMWKNVLGISMGEKCSRICSRHFGANQYFDIPNRWRLIYNNALPQFRVGPLHPIYHDYSPYDYDDYPLWDSDGLVTKLYLDANAKRNTIDLIESAKSGSDCATSAANFNHRTERKTDRGSDRTWSEDKTWNRDKSRLPETDTEGSSEEVDETSEMKRSPTLVLTKRSGLKWSVEEAGEVSSFLVNQLIALSRLPAQSNSSCSFYGSQLVNGGKYFVVVCANSFTANLILGQLKAPIVRRGWCIFRSGKSPDAHIEAFVADCRVLKNDALKMIEYFNRRKGLSVEEWEISEWRQSDRGVQLSIKVPNEDGRIVEHLGSLCFELNQVKFDVKWPENSTDQDLKVSCSPFESVEDRFMLIKNRRPIVLANRRKKRTRTSSGQTLVIVTEPDELPPRVEEETPANAEALDPEIYASPGVVIDQEFVIEDIAVDGEFTIGNIGYLLVPS